MPEYILSSSLRVRHISTYTHTHARTNAAVKSKSEPWKSFLVQTPLSKEEFSHLKVRGSLVILQVHGCLASNPDSQWRKVADKNGGGDGGVGGVAVTKSLKSHEDLALVSHLELLNRFNQFTVACAEGGARSELWEWPPSWDHLVLLICFKERNTMSQRQKYTGTFIGLLTA